MSGYSGGGASHVKPTLKTWNPAHYSSKSDLEANLKTLRERAFDLAINSPLGAAVITTLLNGTVGSGLKLYPQPKFKELGISAEAAREWARKVQLEFAMWADNLTCDFYKRNNFYELQRIAFQSYLTDGDIFCLFRRRMGGAYSLRLQLIESQRISNPIQGTYHSVEMAYGSHRIINGIEVDRGGRLVAIWISNRLWNEPSLETELEWKRVKVYGENGYRNALQICYDTRADQFRGAPVLSPVVETLKQIARYADAELSSAIIKSFFSLFFIQQEQNLGINQVLPQEDVDLREYKLGSGTLNLLPRGVDVKSVESNNAQNTFDAFITKFIEQVGAAVGLPYEVMIQHFQSSYSASRGAILEAEKTFRQRRAAFINDFLQPVYETFLIEGISTGRIEAAGFFDDPLKKYCWSRADFRTEKNHSIDELKEVNAAVMRIKNGLSTREEEVARMTGGDFYDVAAQLKNEGAALED